MGISNSVKQTIGLNISKYIHQLAIFTLPINFLYSFYFLKLTVVQQYHVA